MRVDFWGTRGSLPVAQTGDAVLRKVSRALLAAGGQTFADEDAARAFAEEELDFATAHTYGGATTCVELEGADGSFLVCDMGSGLREFGIDSVRRTKAGHAKTYNFLMSHLHWDHIMGFPFFAPAFDPDVRIVVHSGHADAEQALRRQQEEISFPVAFDWLRATIEFVTLETGRRYPLAGGTVELLEQNHSHQSFGYRYEAGGTATVFSTDSEHKLDDLEAEQAAVDFFSGADLVICDTMYSMADSVTLKEDWGHSSNIVAVDLCHAAKAKRLALFHHEPTYSDEDIMRLHTDTIRYEELTRNGSPLEVLCAYDGLQVRY